MKLTIEVELAEAQGTVGWKATVPDVPTIREAYGVRLANVLTSIAADLVEHAGGAAQ